MRSGSARILGCATQMLSAESQSGRSARRWQSLKGVKLVAKIYWPEASRAAEGEIIEKARQIAEQNQDVKGHISDLICSLDLDEFSTKGIRKALGIATEGHRVLRGHAISPVVSYHRLDR